MPKYDERLLSDFANRFLGYGSLKSNIWLIGPEQGGVGTIDDLYWRASLWSKRGEKETEDLHSYHADLKAVAIANAEVSEGASHAATLKLSKFDWTRNIQPTWGPLIRVILALNGEKAETQDVKDFQKRELGGVDGENCVLDLNALSSPRQSEWKQIGESGLRWLRTREQCEEHLAPLRCDLLRKRLARYKPCLVLFYGLSHKHWWERSSLQRIRVSGRYRS